MVVKDCYKIGELHKLGNMYFEQIMEINAKIDKIISKNPKVKKLLKERNEISKKQDKFTRELAKVCNTEDKMYYYINLGK